MLEYSPELIDYRLKSYKDSEGRHIVRGHLIGTKVGDRGWSVSPKTIDERRKLFHGQDWIVSPVKFDPSEHFLVGKTYEEQVEKQKAVKKGTIINTLGPFSYNDGTDDKYYDFEAEVTDPEVSKALVEGRLPFATSPYIWPLKDGKPIHFDELSTINKVGVEDWIPVHEALVTRGTFGDISTISKQCLGPIGQCTQALAGSSVDVAQFLSSQIHSEKPLNTEMDTNPTDIPNTPATTEETKAPVAPVSQVENKENEEVNKKIEVTAEELEAMKTKAKNYDKLVIKDRARELENIFNSFPDEATKAKIMKKWVAIEENDILVDFYNDILQFNKIAQKAAKNPLVGNAEEATEEKKEEKTDFPLTGNSKDVRHKRLHRDTSLTELLGGPVK